MNTKWKSIRRFRVAPLLAALVLSGTSAIVTAETTVYVNKHCEVRDHDQPVK